MPEIGTADTLPTIEGRALGFGLFLAAEQILEPVLEDATLHAVRRRLFAAIDPKLVERLAKGDVIVAGEITDTQGAAPRALQILAETGVVALVAERFAPGVQDAAAAAGIVALVVDTPSILRTGDRLRLDLDAAKVVDLSSGDRVAIRNASNAVDRTRLRAALARSTK
ncbi:MAG: hypothetical protein LC118_02370 [Dehalococcoidia bacterium]|nr:hypothetical protein [Dehalococcoidia bacterium]MEB2284252.1 hypothetical protein [Myxococcales bacterium]